MADNTQQLAQEFTDLVLSTIEMEEKSPTRPRRPILVAFQVKMPVRLRNRIRKAAREKGIEQTQLTIHALRQITACLLEGRGAGPCPDYSEGMANGFLRNRYTGETSKPVCILRRRIGRPSGRCMTLGP